MHMQYDHKILIQDLVPRADTWLLRADMAHWCYVNLGACGWLHDPNSFEFEHAHDMTAFKLAWCA